MNNNWENIRNTAEKFGDDLDVAAAWERFEKRDERKKSLFWIWPVLGFATITVFAVYTALNLNKNLATTIIESNPKEVVSESNDLKENILQQNLNLSSNSLETKKDIREENSYIESSQAQSMNDYKPRKTQTTSKKQITNNPSLAIPDQSNFTKATNTTSPQLGQSTRQKNKQLEEQIELPLKTLSPLLALELITSSLSHSSNPLAIDNNHLEDNSQKVLGCLKGEQGSGWAIGFDYVISKPFRTLAMNDIDFSERRQEGENFLTAQQFDFSISKMLGNHFSLSTGISLGHYRSKTFEVTQELETDVLFEDVITELLLEKGTVIELRRDNVIGSRTLIIERTRYQDYMTFSIPLYLNHHLCLSKKLSTIFSAGVNYSFVQINSGETFESAFAVGEYNTVQSLGYRKSGLIQGQAGIKLSYLWKNNIFLQGGR